MKTNKEEFETLIEKCFTELSIAYQEKYEQEKAERTTALFLKTQLQLSVFMADVELHARHSKHEIERIQADKYFNIKNNTSKKYSEAALAQAIAAEVDVVQAKRNWAEAESTLKKYNYLMSNLKEGIIYFRNIGKSKGLYE